MRRFILIVTFIMCVATLTNAQDSIPTREYYEKKIAKGLTLRRTGNIMMGVGILVGVPALFLTVVDPMQTTDAGTIAGVSFAVAFAGIPVGWIGHSMVRKNRKALESLSLNINLGTQPSIGFIYKF